MEKEEGERSEGYVEEEEEEEEGGEEARAEDEVHSWRLSDAQLGEKSYAGGTLHGGWRPKSSGKAKFGKDSHFESCVVLKWTDVQELTMAMVKTLVNNSAMAQLLAAVLERTAHMANDLISGDVGVKVVSVNKEVLGINTNPSCGGM